MYNQIKLLKTQQFGSFHYFRSYFNENKTYYIDDKVACFYLYGFIKNGITTFVENVELLPQQIEQLEEKDIDQQHNNAKYYCSTVNKEYENYSKELILRN